MNPTDLPLRDIHLPPAVTWWPPAPGWWLVLALVILSGVILLYRWRKRRPAQRLGALPSAVAELNRLEQAYRHDPHALVCELSVLLRRVAISLYGRQAVAGLTGDAWLSLLDHQQPRPVFTEKFRQALTELPYKPTGVTDTAALIKEVRQWLQQQGRKPVQQGETKHV